MRQKLEDEDELKSLRAQVAYLVEEAKRGVEDA